MYCLSLVSLYHLPPQAQAIHHDTNRATFLNHEYASFSLLLRSLHHLHVFCMMKLSQRNCYLL